MLKCFSKISSGMPNSFLKRQPAIIFQSLSKIYDALRYQMHAASNTC